MTPRGYEVLNLVALGLSDKEIGASLGITARAVRAHVERCRFRLGAQTRSHTVAIAVSLGLLDLREEVIFAGRQEFGDLGNARSHASAVTHKGRVQGERR